MTVNFMYLLVQDILFKDQNGYLSPDEFNRLAEQSQQDFINFMMGSFQSFQLGRAQAKVQYSQTAITRQALTPIIYGYVLSVDNQGFSPYPADYRNWDAMWNIYGNGDIKFVQQQQRSNFINSEIDEIEDNPIFLVEDLGFRFYPNNIEQANLNYVRNPPPIRWAYTLDGDGREVYDPTNSIDPVWSDNECIEIISRILRKVGVALKDNQVAQYANELKNMGA